MDTVGIASNVARAVGRRVSLFVGPRNATKDGLVVAYDPVSNKHTIQFDDGQCTKLALNKVKFLWIVQPFHASECPSSWGSSKYRGVHWQKNRMRWMARYSVIKRNDKHKNLGAFLEARHAALAFDAEARKRGRPEVDLNFPNEHPSEAQIEAWTMNSAHYSLMGSQRTLTSQYRGVSMKGAAFVVQLNYNKVRDVYKKMSRPLYSGLFEGNPPF